MDSLLLLFWFQEELEPHERCIRKILEQKGRVVQIVYRLENSTDDVIEGFEASDEDDDIDEIGFDVVSSDKTGLIDDEGEVSRFEESLRSAWVRIQLGKIKKTFISNRKNFHKNQ